MSLPAGAVVKVEGLPGQWSVWSKAADAPGAYFVVANNEEARAVGIKYAVVRLINGRDLLPVIELLRTDPAKPGLGKRRAK